MESDHSSPRSQKRHARRFSIKSYFTDFFSKFAPRLGVLLIFLYPFSAFAAIPLTPEFSQHTAPTTASTEIANTFWAYPYPLTTFILTGVYLSMLAWLLYRARLRKRAAHLRRSFSIPKNSDASI